MQYRQLGRTGYTVSEIGFGAWGVGGAMWQGGDDDTSLTALDAAFDLGVTFVDTAFAYGDGHSERLVGKAVARRAERIVQARARQHGCVGDLHSRHAGRGDLQIRGQEPEQEFPGPEDRPLRLLR